MGWFDRKAEHPANGEPTMEQLEDIELRAQQAAAIPWPMQQSHPRPEPVGGCTVTELGEALTIHPSMRVLKVGDRVQRKSEALTWRHSDGTTTQGPGGIVRETHLSHAQPKVLVYWGTIDKADATSMEKCADLELVTEHIWQPDEVIARQAQEAAERFGTKIKLIEDEPVAAEG